MNYLIDGQIVQIKNGVLLFAFAGQAHVLLSETRDFDMIVFLVSDRLLPDEMRGQSMPPLKKAEAGELLGPRLLDPTARDELETLASQITDTRDDAFQQCGITWWLGRAWQHWLRSGSQSARIVHPALDQAVLSVRRDPSLGLGDVAQQVGMSVDRLGHLFRSDMPEGFVSFRNKVRLNRLDEIMEASKPRNLLEAALEAGFGSYPQFFRVFKQLRGVSPYAYYKRTQNMSEDESVSQLQ